MKLTGHVTGVGMTVLLFTSNQVQVVLLSADIGFVPAGPCQP